MDKYEYKVKTEQMLEMMENKQYKKAAEIADMIDWRKVKSVAMLNSVSEIYEHINENQKSREILFVAYDRSPKSKKIMYRLALLALKVGEIQEAADCYEEFVKLAPKDPNQYILKYKILKAQNAEVKEQIATLEELKDTEYVERWAYELANLYSEAGMTARCIEECDDLILWFSEGTYVYRAMELKMKYKPLTPLQQEKYDSRPKERPSHHVYSGAVKKVLEGEPVTKLEEPKKESLVLPVETKEEPQSVNTDSAQETMQTASIDEEARSGQEQDLELKISGQMKIEEILAEWEEKQKEHAKAIEVQKEIDEVRLSKEREEAQERLSKGREKVQQQLEEDYKKKTEQEKKEEKPDFSTARLFDEDYDEEFVDQEDHEENIESKVDSNEFPVFNEEEFEEDFGDVMEDSKSEIAKEEQEEIVVSFDEDDSEEEDFNEEDLDAEDLDAEDLDVEDFDEEDLDLGDFDDEDLDDEDLEEDDFEEDDFDEEFEISDDDAFEDELQLTPAKDLKEVEDDFDEDDLEDEEDSFVQEEVEEDDFEEAEDIVEEDEEEFDLDKALAAEQEEPSEEEIQRRIKKSKGGVPFDTGFVVTGRYDLNATSEIGLKAGLTEEQKKLFSYFVPVRGMSEQIVEVLDNDRRVRREGTSKVGNILVVGRRGSGKTVLAVDIVKAVQKQRNLKQGKIAIVTGESLNKKELGNIMVKLRGGAIIIEKAGKLNSRTIKELSQLMEKKTGELLFVLEDQRKPLERILTANPEFKKKFTSKLELPIFINDELVTFGQTYAKENGYKLDEMGILALYSRIDAMQREDHAVTVAEAKEIIDAAISHSQKANVKHLARRVFGKSTDAADRILLKEEDFKI